jgi:drug/metabolite transporter (DMT)-like permease
MGNHNRLLLLFYITGGSLITVFQRYLTFHFDNFTQNFFRFLSGTVALFLVAAFFYPGEMQRLLKKPRQVGRIGVMSLALVGAQYCAIEGIARTPAVLAGLIATLGIPITIILSAIIFPDEKQVLKSRVFLLGALLALGGSIGLPLLQGHWGNGLSAGAWYLLVSITIGALVMVWLKRILQEIHPICLAGVNCAFTCLCFLAAGLIWGNLASIREAAALPVLVLVISGAFGLLVGGWLAMVNIKVSGMVRTRLAELGMPVLIGILGFLCFNETLTPGQGINGLIILTGCLIIILRRNEKAAPAHRPVRKGACLCTTK